MSINWRTMIEHYKTIQHGEKDGFFAWLEAEYGVKKSKFHYERRKREGRLKRTPREKDQRKRELVQLIMEMKERGRQRSGDPREMATQRCLNRLTRKGIMEPGELSASHADYIARSEFGFREKTPRVRWECDYALQEVQTDGSTSKFFRPIRHVVNERGEPDVLLKAAHRPIPSRHNTDKEKLILWQYMDKYSRLRTVRGFPGKAESTAIMAAHMKFWLNRERDEHPMYHLPWQLASDNGSLFKTQEYASLAKALEFDTRNSVAYEKTGIGSVENRWKPIWQWELEWSEDYPQMLLSEYNDLLHQAMAAEQEQQHPYFEGTKGEIYQQSILAQTPRPRVVEVDIMRLMSASLIRKVNAELTVSTPETGKLRVPQYWYGVELIGRQVEVFMNWRGDYMAQLVDVPDYAPEEARTHFELTEFAHRSKGDFSGSHKRTYQQLLKDQIKSGDGLYDEIMSGKVALDEEGQPYDTGTGELLEAPQPIALQPRKEVHIPESPFTDTPRPSTGSGHSPQGETFTSAYEAKVWIGHQLKALGLDYSDVARHFDSRIVDFYELDRSRISRAVQLIKDSLGRKAVNS